LGGVAAAESLGEVLAGVAERLQRAQPANGTGRGHESVDGRAPVEPSAQQALRGVDAHPARGLAPRELADEHADAGAVHPGHVLDLDDAHAAVEQPAHVSAHRLGVNLVGVGH
jgi:hypothetical protein